MDNRPIKNDNLTKKSPIGTPSPLLEKLKSNGADIIDIGGIRVIREFKSEAKVDETSVWNNSEPDRPFKEMIYVGTHDSRSETAAETYVQMIMGKGIRVKAKKKSVKKKIQKFIRDIKLNRKAEDGLYSLVYTGNLLMEKAPMHSDVKEVDIKTIVGAHRNSQNELTKYIQHVNNKDRNLNPNKYIHFKFTNVAQEVWGRGLMHSIMVTFEDPDTGDTYAAPITMMKRIEDNMLRISDRYASPTQMFIFEDASDDFIKEKTDEIGKLRAGTKAVTNRPFDVKTFEAQGNAKFDGYIQHIQKDVLEVGSKFPLAFLNAGFSARASSQTSETIIGRKARRIRDRYLEQWKQDLIMPYCDAIGMSVDEDDFELIVEEDSKSDVEWKDVEKLAEKKFITRPEVRQYLLQKTTFEIDEDDMREMDELQPEPKNDIPQDEPEKDPDQRKEQPSRMDRGPEIKKREEPEEGKKRKKKYGK